MDYCIGAERRNQRPQLMGRIDGIYNRVND